MKPDEAKRRFDVLTSDRSNVEGTWEIIEKYVTPYRGEMFRVVQGEQSVDWTRRDIFDSTAIVAAQNLASALQGSMTPPAIKWFNLGFKDSRINQDHDAMKWLEEAGNICFMALNDSNFNLEANETYLDLVGFGSSVIVEEAETDGGWQGLAFQSIPIKECFFEQDSHGNVYRLYRKLEWTPTQIVERFVKGDDKGGVPDTIIAKANSPTGSTDRYDVIFVIYRRPDKNGKFPSTEENRPYGHYYFLHQTGTMLGSEGGYYEMPAFVPRWRKTNGSKWGHSPAMLALGDILTLNKLVELILTAAEKVTDPVTLTTERGLLSDLDLAHGGIAIVRNIDDVKAYESKARFDVSDLQREKLQDQINRAFFVDQLQLKQSPAMTASEVHARMELMQRLLGPTLARLQTDFLDPLIYRTFNILRRAKQLPDMPGVVSDNIEKEDLMEVSYISPLYRAQRADVVVSIQQWLATIGPLAEIFPDIMDIPNEKEIGRGVGEILGVPLKMINSEKDAKAKKANRRADEERAANLEAIKTLGRASKDVAQAGAITQ